MIARAHGNHGTYSDKMAMIQIFLYLFPCQQQLLSFANNLSKQVGPRIGWA